MLTGHDLGDITINIAEADDAERERRRTAMHEPYRTLLGHFRHEVGHYYWDRLVRDAPALSPYREIFGDEREDYNAALQKHYKDGPPADWREHFVSAYATTHPWEDFAETWAHYLHIVDTLETARSFGIRIDPKGLAAAEVARHQGRFLALQGGQHRADRQGLGAAYLRDQQPEQEHGPARLLSLRAHADDHREARLRS